MQLLQYIAYQSHPCTLAQALLVVLLKELEQ
jgi:hypothetical protein